MPSGTTGPPSKPSLTERLFFSESIQQPTLRQTTTLKSSKQMRFFDKLIFCLANLRLTCCRLLLQLSLKQLSHLTDLSTSVYCMRVLSQTEHLHIFCTETDGLTTCSPISYQIFACDVSHVAVCCRMCGIHLKQICCVLMYFQTY